MNVHLDGRYVFATDLLTAGRWKVGDQLAEAEMIRHKERDERFKAYRMALNYLSYRPRSVREVETHLQGNGFLRKAIIHVLQRLVNENVLDDETFANFWIENRIRFKPRGIYALKWELKQKGVAEEIVGKALKGLVEFDLARNCVQKKYPAWQDLNRRELNQRIYNYLKNRGFAYDTIMDTIRHFIGLASLETKS